MKCYASAMKALDERKRKLASLKHMGMMVYSGFVLFAVMLVLSFGIVGG